MTIRGATAACLMIVGGVASAEERTDAPRPIPLTRPEMKQLLEEMKVRTPRIPLPELTPEEKEKLGERGTGYESRLRSLYMPGSEARRAANAGAGGREPGTPKAAGGFDRNSDPAMTLPYPFKTELFWIVSRANNCQYCLGHQEMKLAVAGLSEDEIAALDGDWSQFTPARKAAFAFAKKVTNAPHTIGDADVDDLRKHYTDLQILEMVLSTAGNNSINRWKEGVGVPQSKELGSFASRADAPIPADRILPTKSFLTPTPAAFQTSISKVAPLQRDDKTGEPSRDTICERPALESWSDVEAALAKARDRTPRLPLVDPAKARELVSETGFQGDPPQWVRLLANFPKDAARTVSNIRNADEKGDLTPLLKAQVSWIIARQDRAWYATGLAEKRLTSLGQTPEQIAALDGDWSGFSPAERAQFTLARKLAASPVVLTDDDVSAALKLVGPRDVVQLISYTTTRASFDRITEAAGLQLEP